MRDEDKKRGRREKGEGREAAEGENHCVSLLPSPFSLLPSPFSPLPRFPSPLYF
jgi:hypothetical protein